MNKKTCCLYKVIAVIMAIICTTIIVLFSGVRIVYADAYNTEPEIDFDAKTLALYMRPYAGLDGYEACNPVSYFRYPNKDAEGKTDYDVYVYVKSELYDSDGNKMTANDTLEKGKQYTYKFEFASASKKITTKPLYDISDFKVDFYDALTEQKYSIDKSNVVDQGMAYHTYYEYTITATDMPSKDLGYTTVDLTDGRYTPSDSKTFFAVYIFMEGLTSEGKITWDTEHDIDVDKDGTYDINVHDKLIDKTDANSLKGSKTFALGEAGINAVNEMVYMSPNYYYSSVRFVFDKIDISTASISGIADKEYTGSDIKQSLVIKEDNNTLVEGKDYTVTYSDNKNPGTATVTITGMGMYKGTATKSFKITKKDDNKDNSKDDNKDADIPEIKGTVHGTLETGLWVEKEDGTYPMSQWGKVNGKIYYFDKRGYAAANEYADGKWFNADGTINEAYSMEWKSNETGWWIEDKSGWYPVSQWLKIDGYFYYFTASGYMDYSEYRDGCWLGDDGAWVEAYANGHWCSDSSGWWYEDNGWYPYSQYLWIDGTEYWFGADGYWR